MSGRSGYCSEVSPTPHFRERSIALRSLVLGLALTFLGQQQFGKHLHSKSYLLVPLLLSEEHIQADCQEEREQRPVSRGSPVKPILDQATLAELED